MDSDPVRIVHSEYMGVTIAVGCSVGLCQKPGVFLHILFVWPALADWLTSSVCVSFSYTFMFSLLHRCLMNSFEHFLIDYKETSYAREVPDIIALFNFMFVFEYHPTFFGSLVICWFKKHFEIHKNVLLFSNIDWFVHFVSQNVSHEWDNEISLFKAIPWLVVSISCCPSAWRLQSSWTISRLVLFFNSQDVTWPLYYRTGVNFFI